MSNAGEGERIVPEGKPLVVKNPHVEQFLPEALRNAPDINMVDSFHTQVVSVDLIVRGRKPNDDDAKVLAEKLIALEAKFPIQGFLAQSGAVQAFTLDGMPEAWIVFSFPHLLKEHVQPAIDAKLALPEGGVSPVLNEEETSAVLKHFGDQIAAAVARTSHDGRETNPEE